MPNIVKIWENKGWINGIDAYGPASVVFEILVR